MLESPDFNGIEKYLETHRELKRLYEEHKELKRQIIKFEKKSYLTAPEAEEEKRLKKLKLSGKDRILKILEALRNE